LVAVASANVIYRTGGVASEIHKKGRDKLTAIAPPGQEGWTRHQEKYREATFDGADGVVVQVQRDSVGLGPPPRLRDFLLLPRHFLIAQHPSWPAGAMLVSHS